MKHILAHPKFVLGYSYSNQLQQLNSPSPLSFIYLFHHGLKQKAYILGLFRILKQFELKKSSSSIFELKLLEIGYFLNFYANFYVRQLC